MNKITLHAFIDELEKIASSNPLMSKDSRHITYIRNEKDYYKTRDFYNKLGFEEETSWDDPGDKGSMFRIGKNTVIELMHDGERSTSPWRMSKRVQNVDKAYHYLSNKGIDASKPTTREWGDRDSTIHDPIGNRLTYFTPVHTKTASVIPRKLLLDANKDKDIEGYVYPNKKVNRVAIHKDNEVVGFFTPREENGYHRVGALYVRPEYRGQGLASKAIGDYMADKKSKVLIEDTNIASIKAHLKAGYVKGNKSMVEGMHWYIKEPNTKTASAVAVKRDPQKWEQAKQEAKAKMGGKHSARAMQLAVKIYKDKGGTYSGKKPTPANNSMRKWTKQDWQTRPGTSEIAQKSDGSTSRYLPRKKWNTLSRKEQVATDNKKLNANTQYISNTSSAKVKGNAKYY